MTETKALQNNTQHVAKIKTLYDGFEKFLLKNGLMPHRDTGIGFWGVTHINDVNEVFTRIKLHEHNHFLDLGSGDGRVVLVAALHAQKATGVEFDDWLLNTSLDIKRRAEHPREKSIRFLKDDFMRLNFSEYDIIYVSPDKPFFRGLEQKIKRELTGKLIVHGYEFLPQSLNKENEWIINGERFTVFTNQSH